MRKSSRPGFFNVPTCAAKKKSTVVVGVVLQYGHYEDKALKIFKLQHRVDFEVPVSTTRQLVNVREGGDRRK